MTRLPDFLPYHKELTDFLVEHEPAIWDWFRSDKLTEHAHSETRLELLKNTVQLEPEMHADLFSAATQISKRLNIDAKVSLYQGTSDARNAALYFIPDEINIVFEGDTLDMLTPAELDCLLAHEMAHFLHRTRDESRYYTSDRILTWICGENGAHVAHVRSLWLSQIYQEIFADRIGYAVCEDRDVAIALLIKMGSGLKKFSVEKYLDQAREVVELNNDQGSKGYTHPETYIRAIALDNWAKEGTIADDALRHLVEGERRVDRLDLLAQQKLQELTRAVIQTFLQPEWGQSDDLVAHAAGYFPNYDSNDLVQDGALQGLSEASEDVKDYLASVILDFAVIDPELEDLPLMAALSFTKEHGFMEQFEKAVVKDLGITKKKLAALHKAFLEKTND